MLNLLFNPIRVMGSSLMTVQSLVLIVSLSCCFWVSTNEAQTIDEARTALLAIKNAVGSSNPSLASWTSTTNPCTDKWAGVTCNSDNSSVTKLNVSSFSLQGQIPSNAFSSLSSLTSLDLSQNSLQSPLPNLDNLTKLYDLNLSKNGFQETFPTTILSLKSIVELHIENNLFNGPLPDTISTLTKLEQLWMGNCSIQGPLPSTLTSLPITTLTAWGNTLNMQLPSEWSVWVSLTYLNLRNTDVYGTLPDSWKAFTKLQTLRLYNNKITGSIPDSWSSMTSLTEIRLEENDLSGTVPNWVGNIPNTSKIEFKCNFLQGPIPTFFNDSTWKGNCFNNLSNDHSKACGDNISCQEFFNASSSKSLSKGAIAGIVVATIVVFAVLIAMFYVFGPLRGSKQRRFRRGDGDDAGPWEIPPGVRRFTFREISKATKSFNESSEIGEGGFGKVYIGELEDNKYVAIKRASEFSVQGTREFRNEIILLSRLHHRHLVRLEGFCDEKGEQILVYEYMSNGNLHRHLFGYDKQASSLNWYRRLEIALGVAQGLDYLHTFADPPVIHRDVKPSNILLDSNMIARVADFGISKSNPEFDTHVSTRPAGTAGYLDPEYFLRRQLTTASDVYGYGVVLLELLTGQLAIDHHRTEDYNLVSWVRTKLPKSGVQSIIDPRLGSKYPVDAYRETLDLAIQCTAYERGDRPKMQSIVSTLEYIISILNPPAEHLLPVLTPSSYTTKGQEPKSKGSSSADPFSDVKMDYGFSDVVVQPR